MPQTNTCQSHGKTDSPPSHSSPPSSPNQEDPEAPAAEKRDSTLTESRLWMKTIIDAIHEDIQNRMRGEKETDDARSSQHGSSHFSGAEKRKDSQELRRIGRFMADADAATLPATGGRDEEARVHMAERLEGFRELFECAGKNKPS